MKTVSKILTTFMKTAAAAALALPIVSHAALAQEKFVIGYTNLADTDFFTVVRKDEFAKFAKTDPDVEIVFTDAQNDMAKQIDQIDNFIAAKVKVIVLNPVDSQAIVPSIEKANAAGIPVIALGVRAAGGKYTYVGSQDYDAGAMQAEFMKAKLKQGAKILYLEGKPGVGVTTDRIKGFTEKLERPDVTQLASLTALWDRANAMQVTEDWIQTFPEFDGIIAANDQMALGAIEALKSAQRLEGVLVSGVDGTDDALTAIKAGEMAQSVFQDGSGQAKAAFDIIQDIKAGKDAPEERIIPFQSITIENVDSFIK